MSEEHSLRKTSDTFQNLKLPDWNEDRQQLKGGGQASVLVVRHRDGRRGVFRYLKSQDAKDLDRFFREVRILTDPKFEHPNILRLLDWTKDDTTPWYISELGRPFSKWWQSFREKNESDPYVVLRAAVSVLLQLTDGLRKLHQSNVVHRDIKPANIVVYEEDGEVTPVLIDFGLIHVEGEDRLTAPDEAVGNKQFSPDVAMRRRDRVPPWLDVFQLAQLLIRLVSEQSAKPTWDRPIHWRWVNYDPRLSEDTALSLRAITALCSEEDIAPRDAGELNTLLHERFPTRTDRVSDNTTMHFNTDRIAEAIAAGKSQKDVIRAEDEALVTAAITDAECFYTRFRPKLQELFDTAKEHGVNCQTTLDLPFSELSEHRRSRSDPSLELFNVNCGEMAGPHFSFRVCCNVFLPSRRERPGPKLPSTCNPFSFYLQRYGDSKSQPIFPHICKVATLERDGKIMLRHEHMNAEGVVTVQDLINLIKTWIEDPAPWAAIHRA